MILGKWKYLLNRMNMTAFQSRLGTAMDQCERVIAVTYDFSVSGGAVGDITLDYVFDEISVVTKIVVHELVNVTSEGNATVTLKAGSVSLTGATDYDDFSGLGVLALAGSAGAIQVNEGAQLKITVGTAALTAGKIRFYVYMLPKRDM